MDKPINDGQWPGNRIDLSNNLAGAQLILLRDGVIQLYRAHTPAGSFIAAIPVSFAPAAGLAQLRYEYGIRDKLEQSFALTPLRFVVHNEYSAMLRYDPGGQMLSEQVGTPTAFAAFVRLATGIASALACAHASGLVHGALMPANIMVHREGMRAWLTGFRPAQAAQEFESGVLPNIGPQFVHYAAPEATGRMLRPVDARSDLYSLGCIYYQLLTGRALFAGLGASEVIHAHLAKAPLHEADAADVPEGLRPILQRLLSKEPQERYQRATDVVTDLLACRERHEASSPWVSAVAAKPAPLTTDKLIGRESETKRLLNAVMDAAAGKPSSFVLVEGPAGIGKTALVQHVRRQLGETPHVFASGKCEQADGAKPYASLARALQVLLRGALGYPPAEYERLQHSIGTMSPDEVSIVTGSFPALVRILGEHAYERPISAHAERPRFLDAMAKLLAAFSVHGRPLVLFLDDLQWADEGTLEVLLHLARGPMGKFVALIGATRENEGQPLSAAHRALLDDWRWQKVPLRPLSHADVHALLNGLLPGTAGQIDALRESICRCVGGNPLFAIEFVRSLIDDEVLRYDDATRDWHTSTLVIDASVQASSVIELISGRIAPLNAQARAVLRCLALLAEPVDLDTIIAAMRLTTATIVEGLATAVEVQLVSVVEGLYAFTHDRVRDAVYGAMGEEERLSGHLEIGRELLRSNASLETTSSVFLIANQLNEAIPMVSSPSLRHRYAQINLEAARRAKQATAYASAISYLSYARRYFDGSDASDALGALIELRWGECEFLELKTQPALARLNGVRADLLDFERRAELVRLRIALYITLDQSEFAIDVGLRYIAEETGVVMPLAPEAQDIDREYGRFRQLYADRSLESLVALPLMNNQRVRSAVGVLADLIPAAFFTSRRMIEMVMLRMTTLSLEYGHCDASCYVYVSLSAVVGARYHDYVAVGRFGELAMRLIDGHGIAQFAGRVHMCYGSLTQPWAGTLTVARSHIEESVRRTTQQGDMTFSIYSRRNLATNLIFSGVALADVQHCVEDGIRLARQATFSLVIHALLVQAWLIRALRGAPVDIGLDDLGVDYKVLLADCLSGKAKHDIAAFYFWTYQLQVAYLFGDLATAQHAHEQAGRTAWAAPSFLETVDFTFYSVLLHCALSRQSSGKAREAHLQNACEQLSLLRRWAECAPANFRSRERLALAELCVARGDTADIGALYEEAIAFAEESGAMQIQALALERAARYYASRGLRAAARGCLSQARSAYACWGADTKVQQLVSEFPDLGAALNPGVNALMPAAGANAQPFDVDAVLRAAQALSGEISLTKLIEALLDIALRYAGADRVVLCLLEDGALGVAAQASVGTRTAHVSFERAAASDAIPTSVAYTALRTRESVVLDDAQADLDHGADAYVMLRHSRSIMCLPLVKQGTLTGLLYLENNQISGAFTRPRLQVLEVLASQAAISLEIAKLYQSVKLEHERREAAERHLRDTQGKLERAARLSALGELVAFVVHEVSQPVSAMGISASAALRWLERDVPNLAEARDALGQITMNSQRATDIIESIRAMAKKAPPKIRRVDIHEAIREVLGLLREQITGSGVVVEGNFDSGVLPVLCDRILVQQVLMNLILNAIEAMSAVVVGEKRIEIVTCFDEDGTLWVSITDTGSGISAKVARTLFDSLVTTRPAGIGMGLSVCKSIVEAHGGRIGATSKTGEGARFRFSIPQRHVIAPFEAEQQQKEARGDAFDG